MKTFGHKAILVCVVVLCGIMGTSGCIQEPLLPDRKTETPFSSYEPEDWNIIIHEQASSVLMTKLQLELFELGKQKGLGFYRQLPCNQNVINEELGLEYSENPAQPKIYNPVSHKIWQAPLQDEKICNLYAQTKAMEDERDPFWMKRSKSDCEKYLQLWKQIYERRSEVLALASEEYLTPAQKRKNSELQIMFLTSDFPVCEVDVFTILELSDEQVEKLEMFRKKMEPEVEAYLEESSRLWLLHHQLEHQDIRKANVKTLEEFCAITGLKQYQLRHNQIDYRTLRQKGREINYKMRQGISEILSDFQRKKMDALIANPPDYIQKCIREINVFYSTEATDGINALYTLEVIKEGSSTN